MDFFLANAGWFALKIGVPVLLPFLMFLPLALASPMPAMWRVLARRAVEHGQLFWTVISMAASAIYDAAVVMPYHPEATTELWWWIGAFGLLALICVSLVTVAVTRSIAGNALNQRTILVSAMFTLFVCIGYPYVHFKFS